MYSKTTTDEVGIPLEEGVVISEVTDTELALIKKKTKHQLELLKTQTERLKLFDAKIDIDYAIKWYEIKSSQFSKLAYFYGQKGWFDRQVLHGEVVAGALVLGLAVHVLAFFAVVGAYYKLSEILSDHYHVEEANKEAIRKSFEGLREELKQSIETFNEMERKLNEAFTALEEQTASLSTTIAQLGIEAGKLHSQVTRLEGMVKQLQEQQEKMLATTGKLNDAGEKLSQEIDSLSGLILEKKATMDLFSQAMLSVVKEAVVVKKEVGATLTSTEKEDAIAKGHMKKFDSLESAIDNSEAQEVLQELRNNLKEADSFEVVFRKKLENTESIHERARRALALKQRKIAKEDSQGDSPAIAVPR